MIIEGTKTFEKNKVINGFYNFFTEIVSKVSKAARDVDISTLKEIFKHSLLQNKKLEEAFKSSRRCHPSSSVGNVIFENIFLWNVRIFKFCLQQGVFANSLKILSVTTILKKDEKQILRNYRPVLVLPYFSIMLERIMYNRLYPYLTKDASI